MICGHGKGLHRWIYMYHYGNIPDNMVVDHIDNDRSNNRIENLRCVSFELNSINSKKKYRPVKVSSGYGWRVSVKRKDRVYRKYFGPNKYEEAIQFCLALDRVREDADKVIELFTLTI